MDENRKAGYIIPLQAVLPTQEENRGIAFVFDPGTATVKKTPIRFQGAERKNVIVTDGLAEEDIIAVAGVSFLADGMKVKLMAPYGDEK
jgi:multidrug efflux pump subunit AcrA (membrane-fusion protein)